MLHDGILRKRFRNREEPDRSDGKSAFLGETTEDIFDHELIGADVVPFYEIEIPVISFAKKRATGPFFRSSTDTDYGHRHKTLAG